MPTKQNDRADLDAGGEAVAIDVLTWLAGEPEMMGRFLALTGLTADGLRRAAGEPGFFAGLLDFVMGHEPTLIAFCDATSTPPERVQRAHRLLSGPPGLDTNSL
jgi:hypothetical protein